MEFFSDNNLDAQNAENNNTNEYPSYEEYFKDSQWNHTSNHKIQDNIPKPTPNIFAFFAKSLGTFSIFCAVFSIFFGSFVCGGLAIVLAILSKGYNSKMTKNARIGFITGIMGILLQIFLLAFSIYNIIYVPEFREQFNTLYEQMNGEPLDDSINELLDEMGLPSTEGDIL